MSCPYRGLLAFQEQEQEYFFGRERYVKDLFATVHQQPLVALIGASGSGKSSVVFAGLIPQLRETGNWLIESFRPQGQASYGLALALVRLLKPELDEIQQPGRAKELLVDMEKGLTLLEVLASILKSYPHKKILLVIDQFEELYTLCQNTQQQQQFVDTLLAAIQSAPNSLTVVLTLRADFLNPVLNYAPFGEALQHHKPQLLSAMNREEMQTAIEQPAKKIGVTLEEGLTKRILDDVKQEPGNLPLLEFALTQLWAKQHRGKLTHQAYEEIGGVVKSLANHAETVYEELNDADKKLAERIFIQLVRPGEGTEDTRCIATREALNINNWDLVTRLATKRLVVTGQDGEKQVETVEVVHEALIREWKRLQGWVNDNREFRIWQERLRLAMLQLQRRPGDEGALLRGFTLVEAENYLNERQEELGQQEQSFIQQSIELRNRQNRQNERRKKIQLITVSITSLVFAVFAIFAGLQRREAEIQQIQTLIQNSKIRMSLNETLDARIISIRAARTFKHSFWQVIWPNTGLRNQVLGNLLETTYEGQELNRITTPERFSKKVVFSPNGNFFLMVGDGYINLWNLSGHQLELKGSQKGNVTSIAFSTNGNRFATGEENGTIRLWDISGKQLTTIPGSEGCIRHLVFSPDSKRIAADYGSMIRLWEISGKQLNQFQVDPAKYDNFLHETLKGEPRAGSDDGCSVRNQRLTVRNQRPRVSFSSNGELLAVIEQDKVYIRDTSGKRIAELKGGSQNWIRSVIFSPDSKLLATVGLDKNVRLWNTSGDLLQEIKGNQSYFSAEKFEEALTEKIQETEGDIESVLFSPDSKNLLIWQEKSITLWGLPRPRFSWGIPPGNKEYKLTQSRRSYRVTSGPFVQLFETSNNSINSINDVVFSPDSKKIAIAGKDGSIRFLEAVEDPRQLAEIKTNHGEIESLAFSPNGNILATVGKDSSIRLWDIGSQLVIKLNGSNDDAAFSQDGKFLATTGEEGVIARLWNISGKQLAELKGYAKGSVEIAISPDGKVIATNQNHVDGKVQLWDTSGNLLVDLNVNKGFHKLAFNPDGKFLATGDSDGYVRLWSYSGKLLTKFKAFTTKDEQDTIFMNIAFSPNGKFLATSDSNRFDKIVRVWDTSGKKLAELNGTDFTFSSDSKIVATTVYNDDTKSGTTWLWDTSGKKLAELNGTGFTFSSDSKIVATTVYNDDTKSGTTWLWDTSGKKLAELNGTGLTLFTPDNKLIY